MEIQDAALKPSETIEELLKKVRDAIENLTTVITGFSARALR